MPSKAALSAYNISMEHHEKQLTNSSDDTTLKLSIDQSDPGKKTVFTKEELFGASCEYAETLMKRTYSTNFSCLTPNNSTPKFELDNFTLGRVLGRGTYGVVQEVIGLSDPKYKVTSPKKNKSKKKLTPSVSLDDVQSPINKSTVAKQCFREDGASRYAIKYLSDKVLDDTNLCYRAIIDMTLDTHFLSKLDHPNILKLRAISGSGPFSRTNFILLDRLDDTLEKRIPALKKKLPKLKAVFNKKKKNLLFQERLCYAYEIASSIQYIHSLNIAHRDLKPDNIGLDHENKIKVFDFGLAKDCSLLSPNDDGLYNLTGNTGSCRYMAPEVALCDRYNHSVDVYSFGIILWQLLSLAKPYESFSYTMFQEYVVIGGFRPKIDPSWPKSLRLLMEKCWSTDIKKRPKPEELVTVVQDEISKSSTY